MAGIRHPVHPVQVLMAAEGVDRETLLSKALPRLRLRSG